MLFTGIHIATAVPTVILVTATYMYTWLKYCSHGYSSCIAKRSYRYNCVPRATVVSHPAGCVLFPLSPVLLAYVSPP